MRFVPLLLLVQLATAEPPRCLDHSQRVYQVNSLAQVSTLSQGFNTWPQAQTVAQYLYLQGVATAPTPSAWLAVGYVNGNFISLEDCSVPENRNLERCQRSINPYRYVVQILSQGVIPGSDKVHAWPFNPANSQIIGNMSDFIYARPDRYIPMMRPWWGVSGWSDIYAMDNGQSRSYGHYGVYTIASAYASSEGVCPDGIEDVSTSLSAGAIVGIVFGVLACVACAGCCYCCCLGVEKGKGEASIESEGTELGYVGKKWPQVQTDSDPAEPPAYNEYNKPIWYGSNPALAPEDPANEDHYYNKLNERAADEGAVAEPVASPPVDAAPPASAEPQTTSSTFDPVTQQPASDGLTENVNGLPVVEDEPAGDQVPSSLDGAPPTYH